MPKMPEHRNIDRVGSSVFSTQVSQLGRASFDGAGNASMNRNASHIGPVRSKILLILFLLAFRADRAVCQEALVKESKEG